MLKRAATASPFAGLDASSERLAWALIALAALASCALVGWVSYARLVRAQILVLKTQDFAVAARSLGFSRARIMFRHLLPNALAGSLVFVMSDAVLVLLAGASVSFLGLGVQPPTAEWGVMAAEAQPFLAQAPWITLAPGLAIVLLALGFSLTGDGLGDMLGVAE